MCPLSQCLELGCGELTKVSADDLAVLLHLLELLLCLYLLTDRLVVVLQMEGKYVVASLVCAHAHTRPQHSSGQ